MAEKKSPARMLRGGNYFEMIFLQSSDVNRELESFISQNTHD